MAIGGLAIKYLPEDVSLRNEAGGISLGPGATALPLENFLPRERPWPSFPMRAHLHNDCGFGPGGTRAGGGEGRKGGSIVRPSKLFSKPNALYHFNPGASLMQRNEPNGGH